VYGLSFDRGVKLQVDYMYPLNTMRGAAGNEQDVHAQWVGESDLEYGTKLAAPGNQDGLCHGEPRHFVHVGNVWLIMFQ
jgi:hypothetical protein